MRTLKTRSSANEDGEKGTLSDEVYAALKESIFGFRMPPGQRYSEGDLASTFNVSRTPLRLALHVLAHEGYMQNLGGHSAWQVTPLDLEYYEDLYDFRVEIEALAVRRICKIRGKQDFSALRAFWCAPMEKRSLHGVSVAHEDEAFHLMFVKLAGNQAMLRTYEDLTDRIRIIRRLDFLSNDRIAVAYDEHRQILSAIEKGDGAEAEKRVRQHIEASRIEIRKITLHHVAIATAPTAKTGTRRPSKR